jgi:hypothetical protein
MICSKHDVVFEPPAQCWCCAETKLSKAQREEKYKDPAAWDKKQATEQKKFQDAMANLTPDQVAKIQAILGQAGASAGAASGSGTRHVIG